MISPNESQAEFKSLDLPALSRRPTDWVEYKVPASYERAGDVIPIRAVDNTVEIDFDGEKLKATRQSRERFSLRFPDGKRIQEPGFDKFMSKVALAREHAREYRFAVARSKEAEERAKKAIQEAEELRDQERARGEQIALLVEESSTTKQRSRNKLAAKGSADFDNFQPRFINPKQLIGKDPDWWFAPRFAWLKNVEPGMTGAEQDTYAAMVFRASDDGVFRASLRQLAKVVNCSHRHLQCKVIPSLIERKLLVREDRGLGRPAWFHFVDPDQLGWRSKITTPGDLCSPELVISDPKTGDLCSPHKERIEHQQKTISRPTINRPQDEEFLLAQIRDIVGEKEMQQNGGMWRKRIRHCPKAIRFAIEDWKQRTPASPAIKRSRAAWLTDRYTRALVEIEQSKRRSE